ncbi:MAG: NapC/NirT family cytochrome c [Sulfurisoma sp.]|nr:NapC/NirT family cytochrome c [Sulfurisoma sp.]
MSDLTPPGALARVWAVLRRPSARFSLASVVVVGFFSGIIFWGGFNTGMEATNTLEFCISCHEMRDTVYQEYKKTVHYSNRSGVRAICSDCHVPKDWVHKMARKIQASGEIYGKIMGTIDTPEKFEAKRLELAENEWARMKGSDSRECRNCHTFEGMSKEAQTSTAWRRHKGAIEKRETCIDCHKGIAHKEPAGTKKEEG